MPRDGSNVYHRPSGIDAVTNTTISSTAYNLNVQDVETDLNTPRPIVAGGTGASNAASALTNLGAEQAKQVVTNYSSAVFQPGSFYSASTATGAPVNGDAFNGICYVTDANNMTIEARDQTTGTKYVRQMTAGIWGSWVQDPTTSYIDTSIANKAVRYDTAQSLTAAQQTQARQNVYAAPFDAMGWSGLQINGSCDVSQERGFGTSTTTAGGYICDGWRIDRVGSSVVAAGAYSTSLSGFSNLLGFSVQTAQASLAAGDYVSISQLIEGYRTIRLGFGTSNAQPLTIAFWTNIHRPGTYTGTVRNGTFNRTCAFSYTQNVADAWEYKTVTIPGDTAGTWNKDNTAGISLSFSMACGTTYTAPSSGVWLAGNYLAGPGQINGVAATTDAVNITGVVVLPGIEAPSAARSPLIMRPYDQELVTCQRYWEKLYGGGIGAGHAYATTGALISVRWQRKRAVPTIAAVNVGNFVLTNATGSVLAVTGYSATSFPTDMGGYSNYTVASGLVAGNGTVLGTGVTGNDYISVDARL